MTEIKIGKHVISEHNPIFFIAEIGINHNGSLELAKQLIDLAKICGADAVKFQKRTPEISVPEHMRSKMRETPWGDMTYFDYKKRMEFTEENYKELFDYCKSKDIVMFASPWDVPSVDFLEKFDVPVHKIASAKLTDKELLLRLKATGKPIIVSTGMSTEAEVDKAMEILDGSPIILLHCNSAYPSPDHELNLKYIHSMKQKYPNHIIGYSGHEFGIAASLVAATMGARVIERHITIDRAMWGTDQAASIEYDGLRRLIRDVKKLPLWLGDGVKKVTADEMKAKERLRDKSNLFE
jgi:N-acetylneuraminate synthase